MTAARLLTGHSVGLVDADNSLEVLNQDERLVGCAPIIAMSLQPFSRSVSWAADRKSVV